MIQPSGLSAECRLLSSFSGSNKCSITSTFTIPSYPPIGMTVGGPSIRSDTKKSALGKWCFANSTPEFDGSHPHTSCPIKIVGKLAYQFVACLVIYRVFGGRPSGCSRTARWNRLPTIAVPMRHPIARPRVDMSGTILSAAL